jgi:hypothetical protein
MADTFYAVTDIKHGERKEDNSAEGKYVRTTFKAGQKVTGLSKESMRELWDAGALRRGSGADDEAQTDGEPEVGEPSKPVKTAPVKATSPAKTQSAS